MGMWTIPKDSPEGEKFSETQIEEFIHSLAGGIVKRGMSVPAILAFEMAKPLSFIGYSAMVAFGPLLDIVVDPQKVEKMTCVFASRERIEKLMVAVETLEKASQKAGE